MLGRFPIRRLDSEDKERLSRVQKKRERRRLKRLHRQKTEQRRNQSRFSVSRIVKYYAERTKTFKAKHSRETQEVIFPEKFSLYTSPDEVLRVYEQLVSYSLNKATRKIVIPQGKCTEIDHGAGVVLNALGLAVSNQSSLDFEGSYPKSQELRDIIRATGLPKVFDLPLPSPNGFTTFSLRQGFKESASAQKSSNRERVADELVDYLNNCLAQFKYGLNEDSEAWLAGLIGEVLGNAEDHGGRPDWWIAGYLRQLPSNTFGDCHITLFNFGQTIYETMQGLNSNSLLRHDIEALVAEHSRQKFFRRGWTEENLWTLYALQEGVSRFNQDPEGTGRRGHGTADMIEFFQMLGASHASSAQPRMCLISGSTQFLFDGTYQIKQVAIGDGNRRRIIAFNSQNSFKFAPDPKVVRSLDRFFPGTLITLDFFLDPENLCKLGDTVWQRQ